MDPAVQAALSKWPNVPACYGWLGLDRRGQWRLQGDPVRHAGLAAFMSRNYGCDEQGNWFVQNGPQKVYAALDYTPWVLRLTADLGLETHTGLAVEQVEQALLDEDGRLLLVSEHGVGLVDDRDLPEFLMRLTNAQGSAADEEALAAMLAGEAADLYLAWQGTRLPLGLVSSDQVPTRFGFTALPQAAPKP